MALDPIPGFSIEESDILRDAGRAGELSPEQEQMIIDRSEAAQGDAAATGSMVDSIVEGAGKVATGAQALGDAEIAIGKTLFNMGAGLVKDAAAGVAAIGLTAGQAINRTADWLEDTMPLGEITFGDEGIGFRPKASKKATIDAMETIAEVSNGIRAMPTVFQHPSTHAEEIVEDWMNEYIAEPIEKAGKGGAESVSKFFENSDLLPVPIEGAIVGGMRALPEVAVLAAPVIAVRGVQAIKARKGKVDTANEFAEDVQAKKEAVEAVESKGPEPLTFEEFAEVERLTNPKAPQGELQTKYAVYSEEVNTAYQKAVTEKLSGEDAAIEFEAPRVESPVEATARVRRQAAEAQAEKSVKKAEVIELNKLELEPVPDRVTAWIETQTKLSEQARTRVEGEARGRLADSIKQQRAEKQLLRNQTRPVFEEIETLELSKKAWEEDLAWNDKAVLDEAVRLEEMAIDSNPKLGAIMKNQRGAVDIGVFVEGIFKATDSLKSFTEALVKERGEAYRAMAPALHEYAQKSSKNAPQDVVRPYQERGRIQETLDSMWDVIGGRSVDRIRRWSEQSPSLAKLANKMEHDMNAPRAITADYFEGVNRSAGRFIVQFEDIMRPATKTVKIPFTGIFKKNTTAVILDKLRRNDFSGTLGDTIQQFRGFLDEIYAYARDSGIEVKRLENFFPRLYDWKVIKKNPVKFIERLQKLGIEESAAKSITNKIIHEKGVLDISDASITTLAKQKGTPSEQAIKSERLEQERMLKVADKDIAEFLNNDVNAVMNKYIDNVVHRAEWASRFGKNNQELNGLLTQGFQELQQAGVKMSQAEAGALQDNVYGLALAMQKAYRPIASVAGRKANTAALTFGYVTTLALATLSSLVEPLILLSHTPVRTMKTVPKAMGNAVSESLRSVFPKIPKSDMTRFAELNGKALDIAASERITAMFQGDVTPITNLFFKANGLHQWTRFVNIFSNEVGKGMVKNYLQDASKGKASKRKQAILTDMGINIPEGIEWIKAGAEEAHPFFENVRLSAQRMSTRIVMHPRATIKPLWMSDPHLSTIAQLKGFPVSFGNTVIKGWYNTTIKELRKKNLAQGMQNSGMVAGTSIAMLTTAYFVNEMRDQWLYSGKPPKRTDAEKIQRAIDRIGFTGVMQTAVDASHAKEFGAGFFDPIVGPFWAGAGRFATQAQIAAKGKPRGLARELTRAIPGAIALPKPVRDSITKDIEGALK